MDKQKSKEALQELKKIEENKKLQKEENLKKNALIEANKAINKKETSVLKILIGEELCLKI
jgi:hypothetical protein